MEQESTILQDAEKAINSARLSDDALWIDTADIGVALATIRNMSESDFPDLKVFTHKDADSPRRVALKME